jgi:glycosyltransferase involved in cell wall biosynthesis
MKSVIILTPGFPADESDSTCLPTQQNLVRAFNTLDPTLEIIILSIQYPYVTGEYKWFGNWVKTYNGKNLNSIRRIILWFSIYRDIKKIYKRGHLIGILSFWCGETALIGHWFAKFNPIPHYCWVCGQDARNGNPFVKFMKLVPNELVAISKFIQEEFKRNHKIAPAHLVENGIVKAEHKDTKRERHIDVIGVGSLTTLKQYKMFVEVIERLAVARKVRAVICGSGPERLTLSKQIDGSGLKNTIGFVGEISNEEVKRYLLQSKILLHPSSYEGYSTACLEALHAGCFVISFTHPGNVDSNRWLVVHSVDEMYDTCHQLLASENLEFTQTIINTIDNTALKFIELFNQNSKS